MILFQAIMNNIGLVSYRLEDDYQILFEFENDAVKEIKTSIENKLTTITPEYLNQFRKISLVSGFLTTNQILNTISCFKNLIRLDISALGLDDVPGELIKKIPYILFHRSNSKKLYVNGIFYKRKRNTPYLFIERTDGTVSYNQESDCLNIREFSIRTNDIAIIEKIIEKSYDSLKRIKIDYDVEKPKTINNNLLKNCHQLKEIICCHQSIFDENAYIPNLEKVIIKRNSLIIKEVTSFKNKIKEMPHFTKMLLRDPMIGHEIYSKGEGISMSPVDGEEKNLLDKIITYDSTVYHSEFNEEMFEHFFQTYYGHSQQLYMILYDNTFKPNKIEALLCDDKFKNYRGLKVSLDSNPFGTEFLTQDGYNTYLQKLFSIMEKPILENNKLDTIFFDKCSNEEDYLVINFPEWMLSHFYKIETVSYVYLIRNS